ncbi:MAG TPA: MFS transporter [Actinomycetota bacterium]|nr:MFS transporter [Actinomycetota bacterium]
MHRMRMHRTRDRRALIAAIGLSSFGDELAIVALALRVEDLTGSAGMVALLFIVSALPHVLFAPISGWLTDRRETVQTLRWCSLAQAVVATALAFAVGLPLVFVLAFALGALASVTGPSVFALVPLLDEQGDISKTNSTIEIAKYAGWISGPLVAGLVAHESGTAAPLLIDACTFLVLALTTVGMSIRRIPAPVETTAGDGARAGFAYVTSDRLLLIVFIAMAGIVLFAATDNVAEVFFASDTLNQPAIGYGVLASTWLAGMVIGALLARRADTRRAPIWIFGGAIVGGGALVLGAASAALIPAAALFVVAGLGNGIENVAARTLVHGRVPSALHGRVFAAYMGLLSGTQIIATALGGALVVGVGGQQALVVGGLGSLAVGALGLMTLAFVQASASAEPPVVLVEDAGSAPGAQLADESVEAEQVDSPERSRWY